MKAKLLPISIIKFNKSDGSFLIMAPYKGLIAVLNDCITISPLEHEYTKV
jgi:hypothetical protein